MDIGKLNYTFISLVPKKQESIMVKDYRSISLVNGILKIFFKILATRLSPILHTLILDSQLAFVEGRQIIDCYVYAMEIIRGCRRTKQEGLLYKLNYENAFDNLDWSFLHSIFIARQFHAKWCGWIVSILQSNKVALLINGGPTKQIRTKKGLRQDDPLSPFLFILVTDILTCILKLAATNNTIKGIGAIEEMTKIHCIHYADDTLLIYKARRRYASNVKLIIYSFELLIGHKINFEKSSLIGIRMLESKTKYFANLMGCNVASVPTKYLVFPLHSSKPKNSDWNFIVQKVQKKQSMWKNKILYIAGRLVLVNMVLGSLPTGCHRYSYRLK